MVRFTKDAMGRFPQRPYYTESELDAECEMIICRFLERLYGQVNYPIQTDDLTKLIESEAEDLDIYADLSSYGADVEGVTEFFGNKKPAVKISERLSVDESRENRLRTTLTHEFGHVHFHGFLFDSQFFSSSLFQSNPQSKNIICKRDSIIEAPQNDWMEWQAGYVCGAILMPRTPLQKLAREFRECNSLLSPIICNSSHGRNLISQVVKRFQVSEQAAIIRLLKLNFLTSPSDQGCLFP